MFEKLSTKTASSSKIKAVIIASPTKTHYELVMKSLSYHKHVFIEKIPSFNEFNSNQQLRFITLIDIFYEKKISLTISLNCTLDKLGTSKKHSKIFKRTLSRLYEMTLSKKS